MAGTKVYSWGGEHHSPEQAGGWVTVTWAAAVDSLDELRRLCASRRVAYPRRTSRPTTSGTAWQAATARPGSLVFRNEEPTGDESGGWQVLTDDGRVTLAGPPAP